VLSAWMVLLLLTPAAPASEVPASEVKPAAVEGTFRGEVVAPPRSERSDGWLYLRGGDGNVRRVAVMRAAIVYDAAVPKDEQNRTPARRALVPGTEVRVTALVDAQSGEWTASRVEVIAHHAAKFEDDYPDGDSDEPPATLRQASLLNRRTV